MVTVLLTVVTVISAEQYCFCALDNYQKRHYECCTCGTVSIWEILHGLVADLDW